MAAYKKYVYWLPQDRFERLRTLWAKQGLEPQAARKAVCLPLSAKQEVGYVPADGWQAYSLCRRQMSWQADSPWAGLTLVVSSRPLEGADPAWLIQKVKFKPPALPERSDMAALVQRPSYQRLRPQRWQHPTEEDRRETLRWQKVMGLGHLPFEELFLAHCANHANFIEPEYYVDNGHGKAPYSIGRTSRVCSACLELYGIIGYEHQRKLVIPCPGAVAFAGLASNRYYEVTKP